MNAQPDGSAGINDLGALAANGGVLRGGWRAGEMRRVRLRHRSPPRRWSSAPILLLGIFLLINVVGGGLLALPIATASGAAAGPKVAFFTAISAATVTGLTQVDTQVYWSFFGQAVILMLILLGGLEFITAATVLVFFARRSTALEEDIYRDTVGSGYGSSVAKVARNIVIAFFIGYGIGAVLLFPKMLTMGDFSIWEALWQSVFLSVSALNNAGISILPNAASGNNADTLGAHAYLLWVITPLIILGSLGWPLMNDIRRNWRWRWGMWPDTWMPFSFARLTLDTKLVLMLTTLLYAFSVSAFLFVEWAAVLEGEGTAGKVGSAVFHGVSGRTAGFSALDWSETLDFTLLVFGGLMFIGGSTASVAGGIKVNTLGVMLAAARSSALRRPQTEAFRREIAPALVARALMIVMVAVLFLGIVVPLLTYTDPEIPFLGLVFETISAFGTNGLSVGVSSQLSLAGSIIFMITMLLGRIGPLTLVMLLTPREEATYRYPTEPVRIG